MVDTSSVNQYSTTELMRHIHDDVIKWKHFSRYWPFVWGIHRSPMNSPHKGQWRGALVFSLICAWINGWVNNGEAGDLRRHRAHYDVIVMSYKIFCYHFMWFCLKSDTNDISKQLLLIKFDFLQKFMKSLWIDRTHLECYFHCSPVPTFACQKRWQVPCDAWRSPRMFSKSQTHASIVAVIVGSSSNNYSSFLFLRPTLTSFNSWWTPTRTTLMHLKWPRRWQKVATSSSKIKRVSKVHLDVISWHGHALRISVHFWPFVRETAGHPSQRTSDACTFDVFLDSGLNIFLDKRSSYRCLRRHDAHVTSL